MRGEADKRETDQGVAVRKAVSDARKDIKDLLAAGGVELDEEGVSPDLKDAISAIVVRSATKGFHAGVEYARLHKLSDENNGEWE